MRTLQRSSLLDGGNSAYLETLYENWLQNPAGVAPRWRNYFDALPRVDGYPATDVSHADIREEFSRLTGHLRGQRIARLTDARLELNPKHSLVRRLDAETDPARFERLALVLFEQAVLAEGRQLEDPAAFVARLNELLTDLDRSAEQSSADSGESQ